MGTMLRGDDTSNRAYYVSDRTSDDVADEVQQDHFLSLRRAAWAIVNSIVFCALLLTWPLVANAQSPTKAAKLERAELASLSIEAFSGDLRIIESEGSEIEIVALENATENELAIMAGNEGHRLRVQGDLLFGERSCARHHNSGEVVTNSVNGHPVTAYPSLVIAVPPYTDIELEILAGSVLVEAGRSVKGALKGCSQTVFETPKSSLFLVSEDAATVNVSSVAMLDLDVSGGVRASVESITGAASVNATGASRVTITGMAGKLAANLYGASQLTISQGDTTDLDLTMSGATRFSHRGGVQTANINLQRGARASLALLSELKSVALARATRLQVGESIISG